LLEQPGRQETPVDVPPELGTPAAVEVRVCYRLGREIGRGGMGTIFEGRDAELGREVAVKVLRETHAGDPQLAARFAEEARILGRLQHPAIVPMCELGRLADGRPYLTMRLIKGQTLAKLLADRPDPSRDRPHHLKIFEQVCQALAYAHSKSVAHLDLKPSNVMVGAFGEIQVMDWGLARVLPGGRPATPEDPGSRAKPASGAVLGTPAYMSPEQAHGETDSVDERADVFGLGAILCEVLTGHPPYTGKDRHALLRRARRGDLADALRRLDACGADRELVGLARSCLAVHPNDRPGDAGKVAVVVTGYLETVLRRAERDLVRFFELSLDLFCIASLDGFFRRVNANFTRVLGYTNEELVSRPFLDFVHPEDRPQTLAAMAQLSQGMPVIQFRNRYRDSTGHCRWFEWTAKSVPEEGVIFAVARDVTERIQLEERLRSGYGPGEPSGGPPS
jgi:serine/threonine-protein kinase